MTDNVAAKVLIVCTANRCRSPLAAALLAARTAGAGLPWTVNSAGTHARSSDVTEPEVIEVLRRSGLASVARPSRRVDPPLLREADLLLTAERRHRTAVLEYAPEKVGRTFTLLEFERLLRAADLPRAPLDVAQLAVLADSARAAAGSSGGWDDLPDPIHQPLDAFEECRATLEGVVDVIVTTVLGHTRSMG